MARSASGSTTPTKEVKGGKSESESGGCGCDEPKRAYAVTTMSKQDEITVNLMDMDDTPRSDEVAQDPFVLDLQGGGGSGSWSGSGFGSMKAEEASTAASPTMSGGIQEDPFVSLHDTPNEGGPGPIPLHSQQEMNDPFGASNEAEVNLLGEGDGKPSDGSGGGDGENDKVKVTWNPLAFLKNRLEPYFDVDTNDIVQRTVQATVKGYSGSFTDFVSDKPDLYGPFWICTTLIVVSSAAGSFDQYLGGVSKDDMDKVTASCAFFYGYVTVLPLAIWGLLIYHKNPMRLLHIIGIYGYAMSVFIPTAILCTVPNTIVRWCLILLAAAVSGLSIIMNVKKHFMEALQHKGALYLAGIAAIHLGLAIGLKLYFFLY